jgi:hypothetical protein
MAQTGTGKKKNFSRIKISLTPSFGSNDNHTKYLIFKIVEK